jgi:hypothetical protein
MVSSGAFSPNLPVGFSITECARGSQPVGEFNGEQTTEECQVGQNGQTFAVFDYLGPGQPGIFPVTATLDANTVLDGAIYVAGEASTPGPDPDPGLAETGPAGSMALQLAAAAAAVGLGTSFVVWARRQTRSRLAERGRRWPPLRPSASAGRRSAATARRWCWAGGRGDRRGRSRRGVA